MEAIQRRKGDVSEMHKEEENEAMKTTHPESNSEQTPLTDKELRQMEQWAGAWIDRSQSREALIRGHEKTDAYLKSAIREIRRSRLSANVVAPTVNHRALAEALWKAFWTDLCSDKWSIDDIESVLRTAAASTVAPQEQSGDTHPGYGCGGTCVIHSGRVVPAASASPERAPATQNEFEVWWKGEIAGDFVQQALDELEKISCVRLSGGFGPEATAVSAARRKLDSALSTLRDANAAAGKSTSTPAAAPSAATQDEASIPLLGYERAITIDWDKHNARRYELIEAKRSRLLSEDEQAELRELQWLAGIKRELQTGPPYQTFGDGHYCNHHPDDPGHSADCYDYAKFTATSAGVSAPAKPSGAARDAAREIADAYYFCDANTCENWKGREREVYEDIAATISRHCFSAPAKSVELVNELRNAYAFVAGALHGRSEHPGDALHCTDESCVYARDLLDRTAKTSPDTDVAPSNQPIQVPKDAKE